MLPLMLNWKGQRLWVSPERCLFWEEQKMLILSDLHIGKAAHFRKAGIAIPQQVFQDDMHRLYQQIHQFNPDQILITGDLFHSQANVEHDVFARWRETLGNREVLLVRGNHDRLAGSHYEAIGIQCIDDHFVAGEFVFIHELPHVRDAGKFYFTGHQHPGIKISGKGKQAMALPCFYFTEDHAVLPAFGLFSGKHLIEPKRSDRVFAIAKGSSQPFLIEVPIQ